MCEWCRKPRQQQKSTSQTTNAKKLDEKNENFWSDTIFQEFRTARQQVKKMTGQSQERRKICRAVNRWRHVITDHWGGNSSTEPSKESELETSKESNTAKVADVKFVVNSPTTFKSRQVTGCDINETARSLNTPWQKEIQEELGAKSTNEPDWQCQSQMNEDSDCETRESRSNHEEQFRKEARRDCKATLNSQLKDKSEDGGKENIEKSVQDTLGLVHQESEAEKYCNEDETNKAKTKAKNSLENYCFTLKKTHTDEMQGITSKYKVVNYVEPRISRSWSSATWRSAVDEALIKERLARSAPLYCITRFIVRC